MPQARKRKQSHEPEEESHVPVKRQSRRLSEAPKAAETEHPAKRGRKKTSIAASSIASINESLSSTADSFITNDTEPDSLQSSKNINGLEPVAERSTELSEDKEQQETQIDDNAALAGADVTEETETKAKKADDPEVPTEAAVTNGVSKSAEPVISYPTPYKLKKATGKIINSIPTLKTEPLNIYVCGTGSMAELGLGPDAKNKEVKRPRLNPFLSIDQVAIVDFAVGGAHVVAIDKTGKLWSWGCNDHGALGRDTSEGEKGLLKDMDADDDDDDGDLNPRESTPALVENLPPDVIFVQVAASDSLSLALTSEGRLWSWGTFRCNEGILGFSETVKFQRTPVQIPLPFAVSQIVAGKDHVMALTTAGKVFSWGNGQQFQLGRRVLERACMQSLFPREFGIKNVKFIGSGEYHAFAIDTSDRVMAWGLNQFGQCGIPSEGAGEDGAVITSPTYVEFLEDKSIVSITGGEHHSVALSSKGEIYTFGRLDSSEIGIEKDSLPDSVVKDENGRPRFLPVPTKLEVDGDEDDVSFKYVACGSHHNIALAVDGSAWTWGFGETYQLGQGPAGEDVEVPTKVENTATKGVNMVLAGAGGQFSVLGGIAKSSE